jgi:hypothetical protein
MNSSSLRGARARRAGLAGVTGLGLAASLLAGAPVALADDAAPDSLPRLTLDLLGEQNGAFGTAASRTSCDLNGDGRQDTIVGDWGWDRQNLSNVGAAYVYLGGDELGGGDVVDSGAVRIDGPQIANAFVGWSVSCLGDVNGDGLDDMILGSGSRTFNKAYVVLGSKDFGSIDLEFLGRDGFEISEPGADDKLSGDKSTDNFGISVGEVGDINGDGLADIGIIDMLSDRNDRTNSGRAWVIAGSRSVANVDLSTSAGAERTLQVIDGATAEERLSNVQAVGDVNGDGLDDLAVSSYTAAPWGSAASAAGSATVIFGTERSLEVDLAELGEQGFTVYGPQRGKDRLGISLASAGDVNGDGLADLVIGADSVSSTGGAAVVFGSPSTATVFTDPSKGYSVWACDEGGTDPTCEDSGKDPRGYWINGVSAGKKLGFGVASLPDVNGDGRPELVLGAQGGGTWVVFGSASQRRAQNLDDLTSSNGLALGGVGGQVVGNAGDLDGNGVDDVVTGASTGGNRAAVHLLGALKTRVELEAPEKSTATASTTLTASVSALVPAAVDRVAGTVDFTLDGRAIDGCSEVRLDAATAACTAELDADAGEHVFAAAFTPTAGTLAASTAEAKTTTAKAKVSVEGVSLSATRSVYGGGGVSATATVAGATTGTVTFSEGSSVLGTARVDSDGMATLALPVNLKAGSHTIAARYDGTARYAASPRVLAEDDLVISQATPTLSAPTLSVGSAVVGTASVKASAQLSSGVTSGSVTFLEGTSTLGTAKVSSTGLATLVLPASLGVGQHTISARFSGNENFTETPVVKGATLQVRKATATLSAPRLSASSAVVGAVSVKASAQLSSGVTSGSVTFFEGAKKLGTAKVGPTGLATLSLPASLGVGRHTVSAQYSGSERYLGTAVVKGGTLTVAKASLKAAPKLTAAAVKKGTKPSVKITLGKLNNGAYPVGKVRVSAKGVNKTLSLKAAAKGATTVKLGVAFSTAGKVSVKYLGNATTSASSVASVTVKIKK